MNKIIRPVITYGIRVMGGISNNIMTLGKIYQTDVLERKGKGIIKDRIELSTANNVELKKIYIRCTLFKICIFVGTEI